MFNLLTGKQINRELPTASPDSTVEEPWTAEAHLAAARRLLNAVGKTSESADHLLAAAAVHVEAAKVAGRTPTPVKTAPARTDSNECSVCNQPKSRVRGITPVHGVPRDGDAL